MPGHDAVMAECQHRVVKRLADPGAALEDAGVWRHASAKTAASAAFVPMRHGTIGTAVRQGVMGVSATAPCRSMIRVTASSATPSGRAQHLQPPTLHRDRAGGAEQQHRGDGAGAGHGATPRSG